jgi:hypothetical protein
MHDQPDRINHLWNAFDRATAELATARRASRPGADTEDAILRLRVQLQALRIELSEMGEHVEPEPVAA